MAGTAVSDNLLTGGVNEGVERSILPLPQLRVAQNARMRKGARWGKRYGHTALSPVNLGTTVGNIRAVGCANGSAFALVDDQCSAYDTSASLFVDPAAVVTSVAPANPTYRVSGAASGWLPDTSYFPVPARSLQNQKKTACAGCYALGYLWTAVQFENPDSAGDQMIRVVATNPTDQTLVFLQDFTAAIATFGGLTYPKLIAVGSQVVLTYLYTSAVATTAIMGRILTLVASRFSAETAIVAAAAITAYDASSYSSTQFVLTYTRTAANLIVDLVTANTWAIAATQTIAEIATECSIVGSTTAGIYVGYAVPATTSTKVAVYPAGLGAVTGTANVLPTGATKSLLAILSGGGVRVVFFSGLSASGLQYGFFEIRDVSSAGVAGARSMTQVGAYPISVPFSIGTSVYMWCKTETGAVPGYATLLRLPAPSLFTVDGFISCPIELSVQDYSVSNGQGVSTGLDLRGVPAVTRIASTATYTVPTPILYSAPGSSVALGNDFRVLQAKHYTDSAPRRSVQTVYTDSCSFLPMGCLTRVDDRGCTEQGFISAPQIVTLVPAAGGSMTASSDYYYSAVYVARNSLGRYEQSGPALPVKVTMAAGQTQVTVTVFGLGLTARPNTQIEVYRTLSNSQTFYLVAVLDSSISPSFVDRMADTSAQANKALYTQVGQTLANAFPPASRFGCSGGQRLFLGGLMRPDVVQASKLIFGDQSPTFTDSDAFRIVLPAPCTGIAWMDTLCLFTAEGIYIASGDGPDDSGIGDFGNLTRMPYEIGCIEPRSIKTVDDGTFFQTTRGLYLLPRGFGAPVPAGDNVMDTLEVFSIITGVATVTKLQEQTIVWTCATAGGIGGRVVYDLAHKVWSVDDFYDSSGNAANPCGIGQWISGEIAQFAGTTTLGLQVSNSVYSDANNTAIPMQLRTGDIRPFGASSEGVFSKLAMLGELRSACTLNITKFTDNASFQSSRVFALAAGDTQPGSICITETELGSTEQRNSVALSVQYDETSTNQGIVLIALSLEHEKGEGLKRLYNLSRNT